MGDRPARPQARSSGKKTIRVDFQAGEALPPAAPTDAGLFDRFRGLLAGSPPPERRSTRHPARTQFVWIGWWRGGDEVFALTPRLANIRRGGGRGQLDQAPPASHPVWICLGPPEPDECLAATSLEVKGTRRGDFSVRLSFREPCPSRFLEAAVCGRTSERRGARRPGG